jgi:crotonobetaine/carnitine-CoA ligase
MKLDIAFPTARDEVIFRTLLEHRARAHPDHVFAVFENGSQWTYAEARAQAVQCARGLRKLGVSQGDHVISWQPTGADAIRTMLGINYLGAVYVPFNTAYRGHLLEHVIWLSDAKIALVHCDLVGRLADVKHHDLKTVVTINGTAESILGLELLRSDAVNVGAVPTLDEQPPDLARPIEIWDTQALIFTAGTTGPSKGVLMPYMQMSMQTSICYYWLTSDDRALLNLPMFHCSGASLIARILSLGGSLAVVESFETQRFWSVVRTMGVTFAVLVGSMASFLAKLPENEDQKKSKFRSAFIVPLTADGINFAKRIGIDWYTGFGMSETPGVFVTPPNPEKIGTCGRLRAGASARLVDEHDFEVPIGTQGELVVRDEQPWALTSGYHKDPATTARAWRNGWFHTGDSMICDQNGDFFFKDRIKDAIRRRGENISSYEVEFVVNQHPDVRESAAVAVPSGFGEDEVLVAVVAKSGQVIDPNSFFEFLIPLMPYYMVPRYLRIVDDLPRTPTMKVQKVYLRKAGITEDTFDREAHGVRLRRHRFSKG